jgi:sulfur carrier protein ThiS
MAGNRVAAVGRLRVRLRIALNLEVVSGNDYVRRICRAGDLVTVLAVT